MAGADWIPNGRGWSKSLGIYEICTKRKHVFWHASVLLSLANNRLRCCNKIKKTRRVLQERERRCDMKKIALLMYGWKRYFTYAWPSGIMRRLRETEEKVNLYMFNSSGNWSVFIIQVRNAFLAGAVDVSVRRRLMRGNIFANRFCIILKPKSLSRRCFPWNMT